MKQNKFPPGWDEQRVQRVLSHYESQTEDEAVAEDEARPGWTFLTNHAHVLVCIVQNSEVRLAEIARLVGIGERAAFMPEPLRLDQVLR